MTHSGRGSLASIGEWFERHPYLIPLAILLLGGAFRFYNLNWDSGETLHPDERWIFEVVSGAGGNPPLSWPASLSQFFDIRTTGGSPLNPHFFAYGSLPFYLLAALAGTAAWLGQHVPFLATWATANTYGGLPLLGRSLSGVLDLAAVVLLFFIGRRIYGYWTGVLAMALAAFTVLDIQLSHFYTVDTVLLPLTLATILASVIIAQSNARPAYVWGGVALGAALATKTTALLAVVPLGGSAVLYPWFAAPWPTSGTFTERLRQHFRTVAPRLNSNLQWLLGTFMVAALCFVICEPYAVLDRPQLVSDIAQQSTFLVTNNPPFVVPYTIQYANTIPYLYQLKNLLFWDMGIPLALAAFAGVIFAFVRNTSRVRADQAVLLLWVLPYFLFVGRFFAKFSRYMLPIMPVTTLLGAALLVWMLRHSSGKLRLLTGSLTGTVVIVSLLYSLAYMNIYEHPNTRVAASAWIYSHISSRSAVAVEGAWDDTLPLPVGANSPGASGYNEQPLNLYDPDTPQKASRIARILSQSQWLVMSSERMIGSIPKLPDRYAMTIRYYHLLLDGQLGYHLVKVFQQHPQLGPIVVHDYAADESFHVYDHPIVRIFKRVRVLAAPRLTALLLSGLPPATAPPDTRLTLSSSQWAADRRGLTLDQMFPPAGFAMKHPILIWLFALELLGLLAFPFTFAVFRNLLDRGFVIGKTVGLLVWAYIIWITVSTGLATYDRGILVTALLLFLVGSGTAGWLQRGSIAVFIRTRWRYILTAEALFLAAFGAFILLRMWYPDLGHQFAPVAASNAGDGRMGEKQMELAFLNAIARSRVFPPYDPFFAHGYINYYYYGFFLVSSLCKLTQIMPATGFNLAIATFFAMLAGNAFSVGFNLTRRVGAGLAAAVGVCLLGNLAGAWQLVTALVSASPLHSPVPIAGGVVDVVSGLAAVVTGHASLPPFDFWAPTRIVPPGDINEFPYFTYLFADLHPHLIAYPMTVAALAFALNLVFGGIGRGVRAALTVLGGALLLGAIAVTNPWDFPTYLVVITVGILIGAYLPGRRVRLAAMVRPGLCIAGLTLLSGLLYWPFKESYQTVFASGIGLVRDVTPQVLQPTVCPAGVSVCPGQVHDALVTPLSVYLEQFGTLLFPIVSYLVALLLFAAGAWSRVGRAWTVVQFAYYYRDRLPGAWRAGRVARVLRRSPVPVVDPSLLIGIMVLVVGLTALEYYLLAFLAAMLGLTLLLVLRLAPVLRAAQVFLLAVLPIPIVLSIATQIVYIKDWLSASPMFRMNTIFKFYNQIWVLYAICAAGALYYFMTLTLSRTSTRDIARRIPALPRSRAGNILSARLVLQSLGDGEPSRGLPIDMRYHDLSATRVIPVSAGPSQSDRSSPRPPWWARPFALAERLPAWMGVLLLLVAGSFVYTYAGTISRETYRESWLPENSVPFTLNGMAFMRVAYPGDYAGISWLNAHVSGAQVIAEAGNAYYNWMSRVSMFTGLPDIVNGIHEPEQRYGDEIAPRSADLTTLYNSPNVADAWTVIRRYGVRYIYVGVAERKCTQELCYSRAGIAKFQNMVGHGLSVAFRQGPTVIYRVTR